MIPSCCLFRTTRSSQPSLASQTVYKHGNGTGTVAAAYSVNNTGKVTNHNSVVIDTWLQTGGVASDYEVQAVYVSGDVPSGALSTWMSLSSSRSWSLSATAPTTSQCTLSVSIRDAAVPNTVRTTAQIDLIAENTP